MIDDRGVKTWMFTYGPTDYEFDVITKIEIDENTKKPIGIMLTIGDTEIKTKVKEVK